MNAEGAVLQRLLSWAVPRARRTGTACTRSSFPDLQLLPLPGGRGRRGRPHLRDVREGLAGASHLPPGPRGLRLLYAIARNVAIDHFRRRVAHEPLEAASHVAAYGTPELDAIRSSDRQQVLLLLAALDERSREIIALRYGGGLTNRAIARLLGLSESNVGTILHRAITDLRARWPEEG
jgi:DNA-binding CsgD family transcriptional regulator